MELEKHLSRVHRSPTEQPNMLIIPKKKEKKKKSHQSGSDWDDDDDSSSSGSSSDSGKPLSNRISNNNKTESKLPPSKVEPKNLTTKAVTTSFPRRPGPKSKTSLFVELQQDQQKWVNIYLTHKFCFQAIICNLSLQVSAAAQTRRIWRLIFK